VGGIDWIHLIHDRDRLEVLVIAVINLCVIVYVTVTTVEKYTPLQ